MAGGSVHGHERTSGEVPRAMDTEGRGEKVWEGGQGWIGRDGYVKVEWKRRRDKLLEERQRWIEKAGGLKVGCGRVEW